MENGLAAPGRHGALLGREDECALLDGLLEDLRRGESRSLVVRGEAGIGKTALLQYLVDLASDVTVLRTAGVESEMELAYAGLHQLCAPLLDALDSLPAPQRDALRVVFGLSAGRAPDQFLVSLAVLSLLSAAAEKHPLLCVVDDAQWLDRASALTLAFVARRLLGEPVGIAFGVREPSEALQHLPELDVHGLRNGDARALLSSTMRFMLDAEVRDRIVAETRGNPLALIELPRGLTATQLAGGFGMLGAEALSKQIEQTYVQRLNPLSDDARRLLLLAAAEPVGDPLLLWRAADNLGVDATPLAVAETDELLSISDRVTFRHPLVRSAVYRSATAQQRRAVHLALADATNRSADPDRRAWHLAAAAAGPDEQVALELEGSATRAEGRGGLAATAAFLQRAVALTRDPTKRGNRALAAVEASLGAGEFDAARRFLATAEASQLDEFQQARVDLLRGHLALASGCVSEAWALLLSAAKRLQPLDLELARETYLNAWGAAAQAGVSDLREVCRAARALPPLACDSRPVDLLLDGLVLLITEGHAAATPTLQRAAKALAEIPAEDALRWGWTATAASSAVWDYELQRATAARTVQLLRDAGALARLPIPLAVLGLVTAWSGDFEGAASLAAEAESVAAATGTGNPMTPFIELRLLVLQGREGEALALIRNTVEQAASAGQRIAATNARWAAAVLYNGLSRYHEAALAAQQATSDTFALYDSLWALPELVEAAARIGNADLARDALERVANAARPCGNDFALGIEARCRALLSEGATATKLYREAIDRLRRTRLRPELARAHLVFGEWLRREGKRVEAREQLRTAHEMFIAIGMEAFAERARRELQATGEHVRKRSVETRDDLTAQERQIALLARDGLSNPEIGARLFLSPRTVEWHLRKVFAKLDIRSRRQLAGALPRSASELVRE
jgi:DNA-binding CsgD family transcriptional regulator